MRKIFSLILIAAINLSAFAANSSRTSQRQASTANSSTKSSPTTEVNTTMQTRSNHSHKDPYGHRLIKLWNSYFQAERSDLPQEQLKILDQIKEEAKAQKLAWDFYDAANRYVLVKSYTNWKLRDKMNEEKSREIEQFGEPIAIIINMFSERKSSKQIAEYITKHQEILRNTHNSEFYTIENRFVNYNYGKALLQLIDNDLDYSVWNLISYNRNSNEAKEMALSTFANRYPYSELFEFSQIKSEEKAKLQKYCEKYANNAVALYAENELLNIRFRELNNKKSNSQDYISLRAELEKHCAKANKYTGTQKIIASPFRKSQLIETLDSKHIQLEIKDGVLNASLRNIPSVRLSIIRGNKTIHKEILNNSARSYYALDSIKYHIPDIEDGDYKIVCKYSFITREIQYKQYTLSIAKRENDEDIGFYVADYKSGEPLNSYALRVYDAHNKLLSEIPIHDANGFTNLVDSLDNTAYCIQAALVRENARIRLSPELLLYAYRRDNSILPDNKHKALIITDKSAYRPEEKVCFKAIVYKGESQFELIEEGKEIELVLLDSDDEQITSTTLRANEFGSVASEFPLNLSEDRGHYSIKVKVDGIAVADKSFIVDEFSLPSFELIWDNNSREHMPNDTISFSGRIVSYSGHTLGSATSTYAITIGNKLVDSGQVETDSDGHFCIKYTATAKDYEHYHLSVKVSDVTGETLEWTAFESSSKNFNFYPRIIETVEAQVFIDDFDELEIVEDVLKVATRIHYPKSSYKYNISKGKDIILEGHSSDEILTLDLSQVPSGQYEISFDAVLVSDEGKEYRCMRIVDFYLIHPNDTQLASKMHSFFREVEGQGLRVQVGASYGPSWVVAELYSQSGTVLDSGVFKLAKDELQYVGFDVKDEYSGNLSLKMLFFKNSKSYSYTKRFELEPKNIDLPLKFTRFLDTTNPATEYSFYLQTNPDVECAASIYDISTHTLMYNYWRTVRPRILDREINYQIESGSCNSKYAYSLYENAMFDRPARSMSFASDTFVGSSLSITNDEVDSKKIEVQEPGVIRSNFATTITWQPFLRSDENGEIELKFTTSDKLSRFNVQVFAHDKSMLNSMISREMTVTLPVKVAIVQPFYLYSNDIYHAMVSVENASAEDVAGALYIQTEGGKRQSTHIVVPANGSQSWSCPVDLLSALSESASVGKGTSDRAAKGGGEGGEQNTKGGDEGVSAGKATLYGAEQASKQSAPEKLGLYVGFIPDGSDYGSDAVYVCVPVKKPVQQLHESHSAIVRSGEAKDKLIESLRSEFVNFDGSAASIRESSIRELLQEALPKSIEPKGEDVLSLVDALYCRSLLKMEIDAELLNKISACRGSNGGFSWYADMPSSPTVTAAVLRRMLSIGENLPDTLKASIADAARFLDSVILDSMQKPLWCGGISLEQYLLTRSLCPQIELNSKGADLIRFVELRKEIKEYLVPSKARGLNARLYAKTLRLSILDNLLRNDGGVEFAKSWGIYFAAETKLKNSLKADIASLLQYAQDHKSGGIYYPNLVMPFRGLLDSELYAHSLLARLMENNANQEIADGIRLWIMVQKETQKWGNDPAYLYALAFVLSGSETVLDTSVIELSANGELPMAEVVESGNGMKLRCEYYRDGKLLRDGDVLKIGDKIVAKYHIYSDENRSFVRLRAPRPAALRPIDRISGIYHWWLRPLRIDAWYSFSPQIYRSVREDASVWSFECLPEENLSLSEEFFVVQQGVFHSESATIESLYAPHYRANASAPAAIRSTK